MAADPNPVQAALSVLSYSTNSGGAYTPFGTEVINVEPDKMMRKELERKLKGVARVQKLGARKNYGNLTVTIEYSSATFALVSGWWETNTGPSSSGVHTIWLRDEMDDTGGTNGSRLVYKGFVKDVQPPKTPGEDEVEQFSFTFAVDDFAFAPGA